MTDKSVYKCDILVPAQVSACFVKSILKYPSTKEVGGSRDPPRYLIGCLEQVCHGRHQSPSNNVAHK